MKSNDNYFCLKEDNDSSLKTCSPFIEERSVYIWQLIEDSSNIYFEKDLLKE